MMRRYWLAALITIVALAGCASKWQPSVTPAAPATGNGQWSVYFSPDGGCTDAIVNAIDSARKTVLVQAYSFTSNRIAKALVRAKDRGVDVRVILDGGQTGKQYSPADFFANSGIPVKLDYAHAIAHNKVIVIDGETVITGSFNFTKAAETKNAENVLIIRDKGLAGKYTANWKAHDGHSEGYMGKGIGGLFHKQQPEERFWKWFAANSSRLLEVRTCREKVCDELMAQLHQCNSHLCFALGTHKEDRRELVISAGGIRDAFPAVQKLVKAAPDIPGWRWTAFRPRCSVDATFQIGDWQMGPNDIWFTAEAQGPHVSLVLYLRGLSKGSSKELMQGAFLLLDNALGEYDVETRIGQLDFQPLPKQPAAKGLKPFHELPRMVDSLGDAGLRRN